MGAFFSDLNKQSVLIAPRLDQAIKDAAVERENEEHQRIVRESRRRESRREPR